MTNETASDQTIQRTQTIQTIFDMFPQKAQDLAGIMTRHGLHCVGCHASVFETLEQGILGHGFPETQLVQMIEELNAVVSGETVLQKKVGRVTLSQMAADKILGSLKKEGKENWGLRFSLNPENQDLEYELTFCEKATPDDLQFEEKGVKIFISNKNLSQLINTSIDYIEGPEETGFKINNPNEQ